MIKEKENGRKDQHCQVFFLYFLAYMQECTLSQI